MISHGRLHPRRLTRPVLIATAVAASLSVGLVLSTIPASAAGEVETVTVNLDHARVIRLPEKTQTVVIGNPIIADVAVQKNGVMIVTAKSFGETNLIALDSGGNLLAESRVVVRAGRDSVVTVQRGMDRESYACAPACQPAIQLGDSTKFFSETGSQTTVRNSLAVPK
jgi:Flp pilus assembly secretin CpaC